MSSDVDEITQVGYIMTVLTLSMVLNYPSACVTLSQTFVTAG
jgi:hypothetical protein